MNLALAPYCSTRFWKPSPKEFRTRRPWENLYADDEVIISESLEGLQEKLLLCKTNVEGKGLRVNMGKTKVLISGLGHDMLQKSDKDSYAVCLKDVGRNSILNFIWNCPHKIYYMVSLEISYETSYEISYEMIVDDFIKWVVGSIVDFRWFW